MANMIIIGKGPAGISASLYILRAGIETTIIAKDGGALEKAESIDNFYGFPQPISGKQLIQNGVEHAKRLGAHFVEDEVVGLSFDGRFVVQTANGEYKADSILLSTGSQRVRPRIKGLTEFEGMGVSYCAICDAFFYHGQHVAVLGDGEYALHEVKELIPIVGSVTLLTNGSQPKVVFPEEVQINQAKISELIGNEALEQVLLEDGTALTISGFFVAQGVAGSSDLARKIGAMTEGNKIIVNENMETNIPGLYAAGDCVGGLLQVSKAVSDGALAGTAAIRYLRGLGK